MVVKTTCNIILELNMFKGILRRVRQRLEPFHEQMEHDGYNQTPDLSSCFQSQNPIFFLEKRAL